MLKTFAGSNAQLNASSQKNGVQEDSKSELVKLLKPFRCEFCGAIFSHNRQYDEHIIKLHPESTITEEKNSISCNFCQEKFSNQKELVEHIPKVHANSTGYKGKILFQCQSCNKGFAQKTMLVRHTEIGKLTFYHLIY